MMLPRTLVLGIGSDQGDDRLGWRVIELLKAYDLPDLHLRTLRIPLQLLDLEVHCDRWLLVDAVVGEHPAGTILHWEWPHVPEVVNSQRGSHGFALPAVLRLAAELNRLPTMVQVWGVVVNAHDCLPQQTGLALTDSVAAGVAEVVQRIYEQCSRRNVHA